MGLPGVLRWKSGCEPFTEHHVGKTPSAGRAFPLRLLSGQGCVLQFGSILPLDCYLF